MDLWLFFFFNLFSSIHSLNKYAKLGSVSSKISTRNKKLVIHVKYPFTEKEARIQLC